MGEGAGGGVGLTPSALDEWVPVMQLVKVVMSSVFY